MIRKIKSFLIKKIHRGAFRPGHFYHPVPGKEALLSRDNSQTLYGIDLNEQSQISLLKEFSRFNNDFEFPECKEEGYRYFYKNSLFNKTDAMILFFVMRHFKPRKIIEIGSGFSTALMLDTNEQFFERQHIAFTFVEPHTERLNSLLKETDKIEVIERRVQYVPVDVFKTLEANDILFIDSSHVSKYGSDVNHIVFNILPLLKRGVLIHFHDICYPFEYPKDWLMKGIYWNEAYLLRAFLSYNHQFKVQIFNHYLGSKFSDEVKNILPEFRVGGSLWINKIN